MLTDIWQGLQVIGLLLLSVFIIAVPAVYGMKLIDDDSHPHIGKTVLAVEISLIVLYMAWHIGKGIK
jgi:hypothetical protein